MKQVKPTDSTQVLIPSHWWICNVEGSYSPDCASDQPMDAEITENADVQIKIWTTIGWADGCFCA
jgi:hypothetical protein